MMSRKSYACRKCVELWTNQYNEVSEYGGLCPMHESVGVKESTPRTHKPTGRVKKVGVSKKKKTS